MRPIQAPPDTLSALASEVNQFKSLLSKTTSEYCTLL